MQLHFYFNPLCSEEKSLKKRKQTFIKISLFLAYCSSCIKKKSIFTVFLLTLLILMLLYSYVAFTQYDYSNSNYLFENPQRFNNSEITFRAKIIEMDPTNQTILVAVEEYPHTVVEIKTLTGDFQFQKDDVIFVIGILKGEKTVSAEKILVKGPGADILIYILSIPAIPFVLYLFFRTWRFDRKTLTFEWRRKDA